MKSLLKAGTGCLVIVVIGLIVTSTLTFREVSEKHRESNASSATKPPQVQEVAKEAVSKDEPRAVRFVLFNDTKENPIHPKCEIWFRGHGSWWLKQSGDGEARVLGSRPIDKDVELVFYPTGRNYDDEKGLELGPEIYVPLKITEEMTVHPSDRDSITLNINDERFEFFGDAIKAATGEWSFIVRR